MGNWGTYNSVRWGPIELILRDLHGLLRSILCGLKFTVKRNGKKSSWTGAAIMSY